MITFHTSLHFTERSATMGGETIHFFYTYLGIAADFCLMNRMKHEQKVAFNTNSRCKPYSPDEVDTNVKLEKLTQQEHNSFNDPYLALQS